MTALRLQLLRLGAVELDAATFGAGGSGRLRAPVWGGLVRTDELVVLFDSGLHPDHIDDPDVTWRGTPAASALRPIMTAEDRLAFRLARCGLRLADVDVVVNSHLHFDHCGQNALLPRARFLAQREHLSYVKGRANFPTRYWDVPGVRYELFDGEHEIAPGVRVVPTPGHAPGHQSLVVDLARTGRVVLTGDAALTLQNLRTGEVAASDPAAARESLARIRALVDDDLSRVFVSHDQEAWDSWRHAPDAYE